MFIKSLNLSAFGEKMSDRAVKIISSYDDTKNELLKKIPVAFIAYDPDASATIETTSAIDASGATDAEKDIEKLIQSTERTRVFGQVARKMQADGSFGLLLPTVDKEEIAKFFNSNAENIPLGGFIARIEDDVPIRVFNGQLSTLSLMEFVQKQKLPVLVELGGHNFRFVGRRGKPLAIGVYDPNDEDKTNKFRQEMKQYAISGVHKSEYVFSIMDGMKWDKFLSQFSITKESLPELFVLDVPGRTFWQDSTVFGVSDFIKAVRNGEILSRQQEARKKNPLEEFAEVFVKYMPWSMFAMLALFGAAFYLFLPSMEDNRVTRPPSSFISKKEPASSKDKSIESENDRSGKKNQ